MSTITQRHRDTYDAVGAVRVDGVFSEAWVDSFTRVVDDLISRVRAGTIPSLVPPHPVYQPIVFEEHDGYVRMISTLPHAPRLSELLLASLAPKIVADTIGADSLRLWVDGTFLKEGNAAGTATPWHNDQCTYSLIGEHVPSLWIALTDVDEDNSPLTTLAGSHRDAWRYHSPFSPQDVPTPTGFKPWQHLLDRVRAPDADIRVWPVKRGDAIVLHPKVIHGSLPRHASSAGRRIGFSVRWIGDDVVWAPNVLNQLAPFDRNPLMQAGKPPPEVIFPVVWRRGAT